MPSRWRCACPAGVSSIPRRRTGYHGDPSCRRLSSPPARRLGGRVCSCPVLREHEYALLGEQICQAPAGIEGIGPTVAVESDAALDANANLVAHRDKIADRAEMNIGRFVPRMREEM